MLKKQFHALRVTLLGAFSALLLTAPAQAADKAYLIHDRSDASRSIFAVTNAVDESSAGILILQENNQSFALPVYRADPGCTVTLQGQAAQLRAFPVNVSDAVGAVNWNGELSPSIGQMQVTLSGGVRTIAASEFKNYANQLTGAYTHAVGAGFRLNTPGYYLINHSDGGFEPSSVIVHVTGDIPDSGAAAGSAESAGVSAVPAVSDPTLDPELAALFGPATPTAPTTVQAEQNSAPVLVNGKTVRFDAYTIREGEHGYTYFKLRDLAAALSGTEKQYDVQWDKETGNILLTSGHSYTETGGELAPGSKGTKPATLTTSVIYRDGVPIHPTVYVIGQHNYFKLRDIAELFDFSADWDNDAMCIVIDTSKSYVP